MINLTDYNDFFFFLGSFLVIGGIIYLLFRHSLQNIFISEQEAERLIAEEEISKFSLPKVSISVILLAIIIGAFLFNQFLTWKMGSSGILNKLFSMNKFSLPEININITKK